MIIPNVVPLPSPNQVRDRCGVHEYANRVSDDFIAILKL